MKASKKHTKHTALIKPIGGEYHRNEWTFIGAPCGIIQEVVEGLNTRLHGQFNLGYLDAAHQSPPRDTTFYSQYTDKIAFQSFNTLGKRQQKQSRTFFNDLDMLFVNGNHFKGDKQVVFINEKKKESLSRKLNRLTNVRVVLIEKDGDEIYEYLFDYLSDDVLVMKVCELDKLAAFIQADFEKSMPPLQGLVLAGGKSQRMGQDKGLLDYHGKPQREYMADLLQPFCEKIYLSFREKQIAKTEHTIIHDTFTGLGPYGAILSAFRAQPNQAWLTVACDLPYLEETSIKQLVKNRNPSKLATCFHNPDTNFPEPLITIWEPRAYPVLLEFLSQGYSCPRKVLINTDIQEIQMQDLRQMTNVNDPEAYQTAKREIGD